MEARRSPEQQFKETVVVCSGTALCAENKTQNLMVRVAEAQKRWSIYSLSRSLMIKNETLKSRRGYLDEFELEYLDI